MELSYFINNAPKSCAKDLQFFSEQFIEKFDRQTISRKFTQGIIKTEDEDIFIPFRFCCQIDENGNAMCLFFVDLEDMPENTPNFHEMANFCLEKYTDKQYKNYFNDSLFEVFGLDIETPKSFAFVQKLNMDALDLKTYCGKVLHSYEEITVIGMKFQTNIYDKTTFVLYMDGKFEFPRPKNEKKLKVQK